MRHKERTGGDGRVGCVMCIPMKYRRKAATKTKQNKKTKISMSDSRPP